MAVKTKSRPTPTFPDLQPLTTLSRIPPMRMEDHLVHIQALGKRIDGYVQFMCGVGNLNGTSTETKERAVALFYERLVTLEQQLGRIHEDFRLE